jgi:8-oxo-dGTP pyrophosphatase MutT (NUDIX family)
MGKVKHITLNHLISALKNELLGDFAHYSKLPDGRTLVPQYDKLIVRQSAVLLLFFEVEGELNLCLTLRNSNLKYHPGQISFPGGQCNIDETDMAVTALRETEEEIGIQRNNIDLLGKLSELYVSVSNFNIHPFVGFHSGSLLFNPNPIEVDEVITLPVSEILNTDNQHIKEINTSQGVLNIPCYIFGKHLVWGATAMIIAELEFLLKKYFQLQEAN